MVEPTRTLFSKFWNFSQSVAWVMYRRRDLVEYAATSSVGLISLYPSHFTPPAHRVGSPNELVNALVNSRLTAFGICSDTGGIREQIPAFDWLDVLVSGDRLTWTSQAAAISPRWTDIVLESDKVQKLWRAPHEVSGRSKFDWVAIRAVYEDLSASNPEMGQNELIIELQGTFEERFKKEPPSRSTLQRKIKTWC